jgi:hypothetical protein
MRKSAAASADVIDVPGTALVTVGPRENAMGGGMEGADRNSR